MPNELMIDLYSLTESKRIELIRDHVHTHGLAKFMVDGDKFDKGKADRYVTGLKKLCPRIEEVSRKTNDPVKGVTTIVVRMRADG